ncbi:hypothetical protein AC249_AIPGENE22777 [Exaiptasia diaphana]|nr:hypothetical protein AC249_AIPGENE22777 [Exaiptasia diaphana]
MFFNYRPNFEYSDLLGQIRAERRVAQEMSLDSRAKLLENMENLLQFFHQGGYTKTVDDLKATNGDSIEVIRMKMKNESEKILSALESGPSGSYGRSQNPEQIEKPKRVKKIYKYTCQVRLQYFCPSLWQRVGKHLVINPLFQICAKEFRHLKNHLKFKHQMSEEEIEKLRLQTKKDNLRKKQSCKRPLKQCPVKSCGWEGRRLDYHLPFKHKIKKGSKKYQSLLTTWVQI